MVTVAMKNVEWRKKMTGGKCLVTIDVSICSNTMSSPSISKRSFCLSPAHWHRRRNLCAGLFDRARQLRGKWLVSSHLIIETIAENDSVDDTNRFCSTHLPVRDTISVSRAHASSSSRLRSTPTMAEKRDEENKLFSDDAC